jgi:TatD DNase family protein
MRWTDNHCHLEPGPPAADAVAAAASAGVERIIVVGTDTDRSRAAIEVAGRHDHVWATVGVHPHDASAALDGLDDLVALLRRPRVVAIGECGLDYHYDHSPRPIQRDVFAAQIALAHDHGLPLVIHTREAWEDTFVILDREGIPERTVFHCFTGGPDEAQEALDRGAHLSFSGIVTFKTADDVRAAARLCPRERLLVETDSPYLTPVPHRGTENRPALLPLVGAGLAAARDESVEDVAEATWANAERFYGLAASRHG